MLSYISLVVHIRQLPPVYYFLFKKEKNGSRLLLFDFFYYSFEFLFVLVSFVMDRPLNQGDDGAGPSGFQMPLTDIAGDDVYFQVEIEGHEQMNVSSFNPNHRN